MATTEDGWACIGLKGQELALKATGSADHAYPGGAYPAVLRLDAGELQLSRKCHVYGVPSFCRDVEALYQSLAGRAALATTDDLKVSLEGDGAGNVSVRVEAGDVTATIYRLNASFVVDQTFLPPFIRGLTSAFPDVAR